MEEAETTVGGFVAPLHFDQENRPTPFEDDEVHLVAVAIPEVAELEIESLRVLPEVHPFEQVRRHEILEATRLLPCDGFPVQCKAQK